jgi:hypothetical protein
MKNQKFFLGLKKLNMKKKSTAKCDLTYLLRTVAQPLRNGRQQPVRGTLRSSTGEPAGGCNRDSKRNHVPRPQRNAAGEFVIQWPPAGSTPGGELRWVITPGR